MGAGGSQYDQVGVDARKGGFGKIFTAVAAEAFPHAFCKMYRDPETGLIMSQHSDGVGSKSVQRYIHWRETGDASVFEGDADDCLEMNLGDIACAGLMPVMFTDEVAINKRMVPKEVYLAALNKRMSELLELYRRHGMGFVFAGGETADLPDQVRTYVLDGTIMARAPEKMVITCEKIAPGDIIMGIRSGGPCSMEAKPNSGIMSNGLTLARHCLIVPEYEHKYPEIRDPSGKGYTGGFYRYEMLPCLGSLSVGEAIMSPTRHFSIMVHELLRRYFDDVHGVVLNTGGGQTKCTRVGKGIRYVKDNLPPPEAIFWLIQEESRESWRDMHADFNMGIGLDVIGPESVQKRVEEIADESGVGCQRTGYCEVAGDEKNTLTIKSRFGEFYYHAE